MMASVNEKRKEICSNDTSHFDEEAECLRILTASDYFEVLELAKEPICVDDVRKQYRKCQCPLCHNHPFSACICTGIPILTRVALHVHPDKNSCPNAEEAFKVLSHAYDCLSNEVQQARYLSEFLGRTVGKQQHGGNGCARRSRQSNSFDLEECGLTKWWQMKSWEEVEAYLKRQDALFKLSIQDQIEFDRERKQRKAEASRLHSAAVRQKLAPLRAKYDLDDHSSYSHHGNQTICYLCQRKFRNKEHLEEHKRRSKLHQQNLEKDMAKNQSPIINKI